MFGVQKMKEVEISHVPSYCEKNKLPYLALTQLVFFDETHIQKISVPPTTSQINEYNISFPIYKDDKMDVENGIYDTKNQPKKAMFKYEK